MIDFLLLLLEVLSWVRAKALSSGASRVSTRGY